MPTSLGLVGIVDKGNYSSAETYVKGNFVYHNGSTWLCISNTSVSNVEPTEVNNTTWKYLAKGFNVLPFGGATSSTDGTGGTVPQPHAGDEDKVLQGNGTFGKKLQMDVVVQNNQYGYINGSNQFVAFKSQADIDAAVSAAKVGDAVAGDVRKGKTFTNASGSGLVGTLVTEPFQAGRLNTRRNIDGWSDTWSAKTWSGLTSFSGESVWSDGDNIYYSNGSSQYILNKSTSTWSAKTWSGLTSFNGRDVWTDGDNIYCSNGSSQYILNKSTSTWSAKTWSGLTSFYGQEVWTDGDNIYYSRGSSSQYILNKSTSTWSAKTWSGFTGLYGSSIWTDGANIYYTGGSNHYVLNKSTSTWSAKTWSGLTGNFFSSYIWTDGVNIYYSDNFYAYYYVLNKSTSTWSAKTWSGLTDFSGAYIWTDGTNIYYSSGSTQYVLNKVKTHWVV